MQLTHDNIIALWRNRAMTTVHPMPHPQLLDGFLRTGSVPQFPAIPENFEELDRAGFAFTWAKIADPQGWCWQHHTLRSEVQFSTLNAAVEDAYWHHLGIAGDIRKLKSIGFEVIPGIEGSHYWRYKKDHRVSALFMTQEDAWRDAIRVDKKIKARIMEEVKPSEGQEPTGFAYQGRKRALELVGYTFNNMGWQHTSGIKWVSDGGWDMQARVLHAWKHCVRTGTSETALALLMKGCMMGQQDRDDLVNRIFGPTARTDAADAIPLNLPDAETSAEDALPVKGECKDCGGEQEAVDSKGICSTCHSYNREETLERLKLSGQFAESMLGEPYPAVGTTIVVTPHNAQWGFSVVSDYLCTVLAYDGDYVWLRVAQYDGPMSGSRVSTRLDKIDIRGSEEQP